MKIHLPNLTTPSAIPGRLRFPATTTALALILSSCLADSLQEKKYVPPSTTFQILGTSTFSLGEHNSVDAYAQMPNGDQVLLVRSNSMQEMETTSFHLLTMRSPGDPPKVTNTTLNRSIPSQFDGDGNAYSISGSFDTMHGSGNLFLNKFDPSWKRIWSKKIHGMAFPSQTSAGPILLKREIFLAVGAGESKSLQTGLRLRRYSLEGKLLGSKTLSCAGSCTPYSMANDGDSAIFLAADHTGFHSQRGSLWFAKLHPTGDTLWTKNFPQLYPLTIHIDPQGSVILFGTNRSPSDASCPSCDQLKIFAIRRNGTIKWEYSSSLDHSEVSGSMMEIGEGRYLFSSATDPIRSGISRSRLFALDNNGELIAEKFFDDLLGIQSVPIIFGTEKTITMTEELWSRIPGNPFRDTLKITNLVFSPQPRKAGISNTAASSDR
ncbi:MAG: hypothetical protein H6686_02710 [Fibrobacteria bacterium]|nr:hypothetical protein [Fibrobacteria bacterium]